MIQAPAKGPAAMPEERQRTDGAERPRPGGAVEQV